VQLGGLGERCELPQPSPGQCPGRKRILKHFGASETAFNDIKFLCFCYAKNKHRNFGPPRPTPALALRGLQDQYLRH